MVKHINLFKHYKSASYYSLFPSKQLFVKKFIIDRFFLLINKLVIVDLVVRLAWPFSLDDLFGMISMLTSYICWTSGRAVVAVSRSETEA